MKNNVGTALKVFAAYIVGAAFSAFNVWAIARLCGSASVVFCSLGGAVALLGFFALTHETGHLTAAKIAGFETVKFSCLCFRYDKREKKKFSFDFSCKNFGETIFVPREVSKEDGDNARKFINVALGGTVASALTVIAYIIVFVAAADCRARAFFACFPLPLAAFAVNAIKGVLSDGDGTLIASVKTSADVFALDGYLNILALLRNGTSYAEADGKYFVENCSLQPVNRALRLFSLRREEELGNYEQARRIAENAIEDGASEVETFAEAFCVGYIAEDERLTARCERAIACIDDVEEPYAARARLVAALRRGDDGYIKVAAATALKYCAEDFFKGDGKFNETMIKRLL